MKNHFAFGVLVGFELSIELLADAITFGFSHFPWERTKPLFVDWLICMTLIAIIVLATVVIDVKVIDRCFIAVWQWIKRLFLKLKKQLSRKAV